MRTYRPSGAVPLVLGGVLSMALLLGGCREARKDELGLTTDSALARELVLAPRDTATPALQDSVTPVPAVGAGADTALPSTPPAPPKPAPTVVPTPRPSPARPPAAPAAPSAPVNTGTTPATAPAPAAAAGTLVTGTVAPGTVLRFTSTSRMCSNNAKVGDRFTGALTSAVPASNGFALPAGATGTFEVTGVRTARNQGEETYLRLRLVQIASAGHNYPVDAGLVSGAMERVRSATSAEDAKKVAGGALIGALAGQVLARGTKGAVIGAAAGAAAGTAAAAKTADFDTCLAAGAPLTATLTATLVIQPTPTP